MRVGSTLCLVVLLAGAAARDTQAQTIGPRLSALFIAGRPVTADPAADSANAEREVVTPILIGALGGFLIGEVVAGDPDGGNHHFVVSAILVGASVGLLYGIFRPTSPE